MVIPHSNKFYIEELTDMEAEVCTGEAQPYPKRRSNSSEKWANQILTK